MSADVRGAQGSGLCASTARTWVQPLVRTEENKACLPSSSWPRHPSVWGRLRVPSHRLRAPGPWPTPCTACRCPARRLCVSGSQTPQTLLSQRPRPATPAPHPPAPSAELAVTGWHSLSEASRGHRARSVCTQCAPWKSVSGEPLGPFPTSASHPPRLWGHRPTRLSHLGSGQVPWLTRCPAQWGWQGCGHLQLFLGFVFVEIVPGLAAGRARPSSSSLPLSVSPLIKPSLASDTTPSPRRALAQWTSGQLFHNSPSATFLPSWHLPSTARCPALRLDKSPPSLHEL